MIHNNFKNLMQSNSNSKVNIEELKEIPKLIEEARQNLRQANQNLNQAKQQSAESAAKLIAVRMECTEKIY